jgi:hypothetical protein
MIPSAKVTAAALGGAVATLVVYALDALTELDPPGAVGGALATVFAFVAGFWVKETRPVVAHGPRLEGDAGQGVGTVVLVAVLAVLAVIGLIYLLRGGL